MAKCNSCNGVIAKTDVECYLCGDKIPGRAKFSLSRFFGKPAELRAHPAAQRVMMTDMLQTRNTDAPRAL
jgi:hypothetical protein